MKTLALLSVCAAAFLTVFSLGDRAHADYSKYTCWSPPSKRVKAITKSNACVGFQLLDSHGKQIRTVTLPRMVSGRIVASPDGRSVVVIASNLPGRVDSKGQIEMYGEPKEKNPVVAYVYRDGILVGSHRANRFFKRPSALRNTVSHVHWVRSMPAEIVGKMFTIETTAFFEVTIDSRTGKLISREDSPAWSECDVIANGIVSNSGTLIRAFDTKSGVGQQTIRFANPSKLSIPAKGSMLGCFAKRGKTLSLLRTLDR